MKECEWAMNLKWFRVKFCEFWLSFEGDLRIGNEGFGVGWCRRRSFWKFDE
jgi:hypothetical protein